MLREPPPPLLPFLLSWRLKSQTSNTFITEICGADPIAHPTRALLVEAALPGFCFHEFVWETACWLRATRVPKHLSLELELELGLSSSASTLSCLVFVF